MIYQVMYQKYHDGSSTWSVSSLPFGYKAGIGVVIREDNLWMVLIDPDNLNLRLGDDIIEPAFAYGKRLILLEISKAMHPYWHDELGKVRL